MQLLGCGFSESPFHSAPLSSLFLIPAIALLPTAMQDNRELMRALLSSPPPLANTFNAVGRSDIVWGQRVPN